MWVHRGHCPHVVESTALLMSAIVFDERGDHDAVSGAAVRAGYLMGFTRCVNTHRTSFFFFLRPQKANSTPFLFFFCRFVTGLLDSHQDKARKLSMYGVAKTIGLPASFVELRHQGTHEPMPSLTQLRPAARRALAWIWEYYWKNLPPEEEQEETVPGNDGQGSSLSDAVMRDTVSGEATTIPSRTAAGKKGKKQQQQPTAASTATTAKAMATFTRSSGLQERMCRAALMGYLQRQEDDLGHSAAKEGLMRQLRQWDRVLVIKVLADAGGSARDKGMLFRAVKLSREILGRDQEPGPYSSEVPEDEAWRRELASAREEVESGATSAAGGSSLLGKRKKGDGPGGEEDDDEGRDRTGWFEWKGSWTPRPIGCL